MPTFLKAPRSPAGSLSLPHSHCVPPAGPPICPWQGADQDKLANNNKDNALLKFRGNAGSHDINLAKTNLGEDGAEC